MTIKFQNVILLRKQLNISALIFDRFSKVVLRLKRENYLILTKTIITTKLANQTDDRETFKIFCL